MVCSRLPLPSLLGLFGLLLMLSPELLLGTFSPTPLTDPEVQVPLAEVMEQYNLGRTDSTNYFKVLNLMKAKYQIGAGVELFLKVDMVKTTCEKKGNKLTYEKIQECEPLPGNPEEPNCIFKLTYSSPNDEKFMLNDFCR